jgi:hypothetical protein
LSTRSHTSFISQIISAFFMGHGMTGGARISRRDVEAATEFQRNYR